MVKAKSSNTYKITTIKLEKKTKDRLDHLKEYERETYDELINKVLNIINITLKNPIAGARIFNNIKRKKLGKEKLAEKLIARHETRQEIQQENKTENQDDIYRPKPQQKINNNFRRNE